MNLIVETDIGRDADDFFALCYLATVKGVNIRAVTITPGDPDQVAVAKFLLRELGIDAKVGVPGERGKKSVTPFHHEIMDAYGAIRDEKADGPGHDIIAEAVANYPDSELFCIGPVTNVAAFLYDNTPHVFPCVTMQGGFCSYDIYRPPQALAKFEGMDSCPTFNLNGDVNAGTTLVGTDKIAHKRFVGKNVCHAVVFDSHRRYLQLVEHWLGDKAWVTFGGQIKDLFRDDKIPKPMQLFLTGAYTYFRKHPEKKFHDPVAAVCMLHPEVAKYVKGTTYREKGGWGTKLDENGYDIAVELDHEAIWKYLIDGD